MQSGYRYAFLNAYDVAVQVDGDGQHDPAQITKLEQGLQRSGADLVWGSRFLEDAGYASAPAARRAGDLRPHRQRNHAQGDHRPDLRLPHRQPARIELFARDYPHDYPEVEAILMAHSHDLEISEVAVTMRQRETGSSSINMLNAGYYMVRVLLAIGVGLFRRRPVPPPGDDWLATSPSEALEGARR